MEYVYERSKYLRVGEKKEETTTARDNKVLRV